MKFNDLIGREVTSIRVGGLETEALVIITPTGRIVFELGDVYPNMWILEGPVIALEETEVRDVRVWPYPSEDGLHSRRYEIHTANDMYVFIVYKSDLSEVTAEEWFKEGKEHVISN